MVGKVKVEDRSPTVEPFYEIGHRPYSLIGPSISVIDPSFPPSPEVNLGLGVRLLMDVGMGPRLGKGPILPTSVEGPTHWNPLLELERLKTLGVDIHLLEEVRRRKPELCHTLMTVPPLSFIYRGGLGHAIPFKLFPR